MEGDAHFVQVYTASGNRIKRYKTRKPPLDEWTADEFQRRYRLTKEVAQDIIFKFTEWYPRDLHDVGGAIPLADRFCLALRYLATGANYSTIAQTQGVSHASVSRCLYEVLDYFAENEHQYIKFPETIPELLVASDEWRGEIGIPKCIGAIDGTHIAIKKPFYNEPAYINRKGYHSINAMVICNTQKKFLHIDPCYGGCVGDALVYNESELSDASDDGLLQDFFLLGDSGYGQKRNLFIPHDRPTTDAHRAYNKWQRKHRSVIERAIGLWKQRWRCLDSSAGYLYHDPDIASKICIATACLHNICIENNIPMEHDNEEDPDNFNPIQLPIPQPGQFLQLHEHIGARQAYIDKYFIGPFAADEME